MRLICPNCGAQYEVPDDVIPEAGRDVQCSNCGHTWFERPGASEAAERGETLPPPVKEPAPEAPAEEAAPEPAPETETPQKTEPAAQEAGTPQRSRKELDPGIASILREEAARERAQREAEAETGLQSQPDLGLVAPVSTDDQRTEEARRRKARLRGEAALPTASASDGGRKDLLPDIDEINSSLRSSSERGEAQRDRPAAPVARKSGFRRGFYTVLLIAVAATLVYLYTPQISAKYPQAAPWLDQYVEAVNVLRLWLDSKMQDAMDWINAARGN